MSADSERELFQSETGGSTATVSFRLNDDTFCLIIAALEVVGGIIGVATFFYYYGWSPPNYFLALPISGFGWSIYAGVKMWQGHRRGLKHSLALQALQIPILLSNQFGYLFHSGAGIALGIFSSGMWADVKFNFLLGSSWQISLDVLLPTTGVGINLVALTAFIYLAKTEIKIRRLAAAQEPQTRDEPLPSE